jgi:phosphoglycolate phosphatase
MKRENVQADAMVYVGDEERDVAASRAAGLRCLSVTWGFEDEARLQKAEPTLVVHQPGEIAQWVRNAM